jgi:hypothetical protein
MGVCTYKRDKTLEKNVVTEHESFLTVLARPLGELSVQGHFHS